MAEPALEQTLEFGDYLAAFKRWRGMITLIAGTVFALGLVTAFVWPPTYKASSTILIEQQEIPVDLVRTTITSYATQRIQVINQRVMTRSNLLEIIDKYNLYEKERKRTTTEQILEEMREDIAIDMITAEVMDPRTGRPSAATIAFTVGYAGKNPRLVQQVASELTTLYLNENLKTRAEETEETYTFLTAEANHLAEEIANWEAKLSQFKEQHIDILPESKELTTQLLHRTEKEIEDIDDQLAVAKERKIYLEGQLALLEPHGSDDEDDLMNPATRLEALRAQYMSVSARYSPEHPDVISLMREIKGLEKEVGYVDTTSEMYHQLDRLNNELALAEQTYSPEHPDVKNLKRHIESLENSIKDSPSRSASQSSSVQPSNPAYISMQSQIEATEIQIRISNDRRAKLVDKLAAYEEKILQTPRIEGEYRTILRNLNSASSRHQETLAKQRTAEIAREMEKERKGEKFTLIEPAILPEEPISPNRPAIIFLSLVLALGAGVGSAAVAESMNTAVRGAKGLTTLLHMAPLAVIPYLPNAAETRASKQKRLIMVITIIAGIIIMLLMVHFLFSPLDVLWFRGMRKVDNIVGG